MIRSIKFILVLLLCACSSKNMDLVPMIANTQKPKNLTSNLLYGQPKQISEIQQKRVAVFLPLSGTNAELGQGIAHSIEMAVFQTKPTNILFSFYDIGGLDKNDSIQKAKENYPDLIIGPVFSNDVELIKNTFNDTPIISFSSNPKILESDIWTMALLPNQQIERVLSVAKSKGKSRILVIAPESESGYLMSNTALKIADDFDMEIEGLYYYIENDKDNIKQIATNAANYENRNKANKEAKAILSENLASSNPTQTQNDKYKIKKQLDELSKKDTLGELPYDSILLLGSGNDLSTLNSYLRFYDVGPDILRIGTAMWDNSEIINDSTFLNAVYPNLPAQNSDFISVYGTMEGKMPNRMASMGYDATMIAIKTLENNDNISDNLTNPSGFYGIDGIIRFKSNGVSERGLSVMEISSYSPVILSPAPENFIGKSYKLIKDYSRTSPFEIKASDIDIYKYIVLPDSSKITRITYDDSKSVDQELVRFNPEDTTEIIENEEFVPSQNEKIQQEYIDSMEIKENKKN